MEWVTVPSVSTLSCVISTRPPRIHLRHGFIQGPVRIVRRDSRPFLGAASEPARRGWLWLRTYADRRA